MRRQIPLLRGLAILAVVCNHAAGWGYTAMFWWTNLYRHVDSLPNYDQLGSLPYYGLVIVQQLAVFSVPAFLFISGFFIAYAARGNPSTLSWKFVRARITNLLWPYLVWSLVIFVGDGLQGKWYSLAEYIRRLAVGDATGAYFFVPLLCQFYLLSPLIARFGKTKGHLLIAVSSLVQLAATALLYLPLFGITIPDAFYTTAWIFIWHAVYFPLGAVCGFYYSRFKPWLARAKWGLLIATLVFGALSVLESEVLYRETLNYGWARGGSKFSSGLYAVTFILFFLSLDRISIPFTRNTNWIGAKSYGIYLLHGTVLEFVSKVVYHIAPWLLSQQLLYQPVLVVSGMGIPLLVMAGVAGSRARKIYRYLFG